VKALTLLVVGAAAGAAACLVLLSLPDPQDAPDDPYTALFGHKEDR
jgi:hypothetical protein